MVYLLDMKKPIAIHLSDSTLYFIDFDSVLQFSSSFCKTSFCFPCALFVRRSIGMCYVRYAYHRDRSMSVRKFITECQSAGFDIL
ncbi:hypothetical protein QQG55_44345 [Brugia pahangi]